MDPCTESLEQPHHWRAMTPLRSEQCIAGGRGISRWPLAGVRGIAAGAWLVSADVTR